MPARHPPTRGVADSSPERAPLPPRVPLLPRFNSPPAARSSWRLGGRNPAVVEGQWAGRGASQWQQGRGSAMLMKRVAGKPRQGGGACGNRLGAFWKWLESDARIPLQRRGGSRGRASSRPCFLLPSASREKHTHTSKTLRGDFPPLLCYFCMLVRGKTKRWGKSGCITLSRSRRGCTGSWGPDFLIRPLEGQVLTKLYHSWPSLHSLVHLLLLRLCVLT